MNNNSVKVVKIIYIQLYASTLLLELSVNLEKIGFGGLNNLILLQKPWLMCQYAEVFFIED